MEKLKLISKQDTATREKLNLKDFSSPKKNKSLKNKVFGFNHWLKTLQNERELNYHREVTSAPGREVSVKDYHSGKTVKLLMFASNNYLGLANHPYVQEQVLKAIKKYGTGLGGPALLNGYTCLMKQLEERLSDLKHQEETMIFSSGYNANLGLIQSLVGQDDKLLFDELSHASFYDGIKLAKAPSYSFQHNSVDHLNQGIEEHKYDLAGQLFIGVEGVYSMDGDISPLNQIVSLAKTHNALVILDDAHGTGVIGNKGSGTASHLGVSGDIDISMGTFSKAFAMTGGFVSASKDIINYMRYYSRSYMFSASLPPSVLSAIIAGLDILEKEAWRQKKIQELLVYAKKKLAPFNIVASPEAAIIALLTPKWMDIRKANYRLYQMGLFVNAVEYPAVPLSKERFRISLMAEHENADIDKLADSLEAIWQDQSLKRSF